MNNFWDSIFWGNTVRAWSLAAGFLLVALLALKIFRGRVLHRLRRWSATTKTTIDDFILLLVEKSVFPLLYLVERHN